MAAILHFLLLASFFWMLVEGLHLYFYIVHVFKFKLRNMKLYLVIGWGKTF